MHDFPAGLPSAAGVPVAAARNIGLHSPDTGPVHGPWPIVTYPRRPFVDDARFGPVAGDGFDRRIGILGRIYTSEL